ncbi:MAG: outer membrane beta-barrel protein [Puniceicoccaceae bacterium]
MKKYFLLMAVGAIVSSSVQALVNLGEGQIDLNLSVSTYWDSEIRGRDFGQEDFVLAVRPSLAYRRSTRNYDFSTSVGLNSVTYMDFSDLDKTDVYFDVDISPKKTIETSRFVFTGDLDLNSETQTNDAVGDIVTIRNYAASAKLVYDPNRQFTVTGTMGFSRRDPDSDQFFITDRFNAGISLAKPINKTTMAFGRLGYRDTKSDGTFSDSTTMTYSAGLSGEILPKLSGSMSAGMQNRDFDGRDSSNSPFVSAELDYVVDDLTTLGLTASQGLGTTIDDRSSENLDIRLTARRDISREMSGILYIGYRQSDYEGVFSELNRSDEDFLFGASITYQLVRWGSIGLDFSYVDRSSDSDQYAHDRTRIGVVFRGRW